MNTCVHSKSKFQLYVLGPEEATLYRKQLDKDTVAV